MIDGLRKVTFIAAHSDDEFVAAGTLHRLARKGCEVHVLCFAPAATESDRRGTNRSVEVVYREWERSMDLIGVTPSNRRFMGVTPSCDFQPHRQYVCQAIYDHCEKERPDAVFTLSPDDENTAHSIVGVESERVLRGRVPWAIRCQFPWNYSIGRHNLYVRLDPEDLEVKRKVIDAYQSQKFRYDYGAILLNQALADGGSVKVAAAEKFELIRAVV